jgi:hypothetical protein
MKPRLMCREGSAASGLVAELLQLEGVRLRLGAGCISFSKDAGGVCVHVDCKEGETEVHASHVLLAMGRVPNKIDFVLEAAGGQLDSAGYIPVDEPLTSNCAATCPRPGLWAIAIGVEASPTPYITIMRSLRPISSTAKTGAYPIEFRRGRPIQIRYWRRVDD